jgi:uncharacterized secreted protein with C-terminal beta-propeller domain
MNAILKNALVAVGAMVIIVAFAGILFLMEGTVRMPNQPEKVLVEEENSKQQPVTEVKKTPVGVKQFASAEEFSEYLSSAQQNTGGYYFGMMSGLGIQNSVGLEKAVFNDSEMGLSMPTNASAQFGGNRYSTTNVQVLGIDEPDIVKNDGSNIYISQQWYPIYYSRPTTMMEKTVSGIRAPDQMPSYPGIRVVKADEPSDLSLKRSILSHGNILLDRKVLMAFEGNTIKGFDVNASGTEKEVWSITMNSNSTLVGARLYNGKLYLATRQYLNISKPCPYEPFVIGLNTISIPCSQIYHPIEPIQTDIIYSVSVFDTQTGKNERSVSFTGSSSYSQLYMSKKGAYITYFTPGDMVRFIYNFLAANKSLVPADTLSKLEKLMSYDISSTSKQSELFYILSRWQNSLDKDDKLKFENEFKNAFNKYYPDHIRELEQTNIVKTDLDDFKVVGVGAVPGHILNQFSIDEFNDNLRVAVTAGQNMIPMGTISSPAKSVNDVYVLDKDMKIVGSVQGMGEGEQIYSARFVGNRGYVVTFRQTDPLYVIDLNDPKNPKMAGELKVPGYSSYIEPITENVILGVGKEDNQVKLSLYDVGDANSPKELSKYILDEYWSSALSDHHAFLKDEKNKVFFIPGSKGGYVFSYENNDLQLKKAMSESGVERALYINDALYLLSQSKITSWSEKTWAKLDELKFFEDNQAPGPIIY